MLSLHKIELISKSYFVFKNAKTFYNKSSK